MSMVRIKSPQELEAMREGGRMLATVLDVAKKATHSGMTTKQISDIAAIELKKLGGAPAFLGYGGFPDIICISVNDEVVHGIPGKKVLLPGDIISLDFGVLHKGLITDAAITFIVDGIPNKDHEGLIKSTHEALLAGINEVVAGCKTGDIAAAVQRVLDHNKLGIVRDLVGHGVGDHVHEEPNVPNYGRAKTGALLREGMTIAIEPMATMGDYRVYCDSDGWTIKTCDGSMAAHFEHTVAVLDDGYQILTEL